MKALSALAASRPAAPLSLFFVLASSFAVQGQDTIEWRDGKVSRNVRVKEYTAKEIVFRGKKGDQKRSALDVKFAQLGSWEDATSDTNDPQELLGKAQSLLKSKKQLVAQGVFFKAAQELLAKNDAGNAISVLTDLTKAMPSSAFAPELFRLKIRHYLGRAKPDVRSASKSARDLGDHARRNGWPQAYESEGKYWELKANAIGGKVKPAAYLSGLRGLVSATKGSAPSVAIMCTVDLADTLRAEKKYDEAKAAYESLTSFKGVGVMENTRRHIGLGYLAMERAIQTKNKAIMEEAFNHFLKGYLPIKKLVDKGNGYELALVDLGAECLFRATEAVVQWGGHPDAAGMAGRLRGRLRLRSPWRETQWAKRR